MRISTFFLTCLFALFISGNVAHAQNNIPEQGKKPFRNEIGLSLFGVLSHYKQVNRGHHEPRWLNGLVYKRHFGNNAVRVGVEYFSNSYTYNHIYSNPPMVSWNKNASLEFRIGYERSSTYKRFTLYGALDVAVLHQTIESSWKDASQNVSSFNHEGSAVGILPGMGIKYRLTPYLSVSAETSLNYYTNSYHNELTLNPLKMLSVNYHFW